MGNSKLSTPRPEELDLAAARPTIRQSAGRLLAILDRMDGGDDTAGLELAEACHELRVLLAATPRQTSILTGVDLEPEAFEKVWKSNEVLQAGRNYGWRGIAEAIWAAAIDECRGASTR